MATDLKVISDCYDLALYLSKRVERFPRSHRYTLGADIERRVQGLLGEMVRARPGRLCTLDRALVQTLAILQRAIPFIPCTNDPFFSHLLVKKPCSFC